MKKQTLLRFMVGLALIISLVGCQTKAPEEKVEAEKPSVKVEVVEEAPEPAVVEEAPEVAEVVEEPAAPVVEEAPAAPVAEEVVMKDLSVKLIMTSDVNGKLYPYDVVKGVSTDTSLAQVYSYVSEERADKDQTVFLLDAGNVLQGSLMADYYNYFKTDSEHIVASAMNAMGYDAAVPGADDAAMGQDMLVKVGTESDFTWLAANALIASTGRPVITPYKVIERDGIKVAVLGLVSPSIEVPSVLNLEDMVTVAKKWVPIIEARENPHVIVALCQTEGTKEGLAVAQQVRGIDVVFAGQKTMMAKNPDGESVYVIGALADAAAVGTAEVTLSYDKAAADYDVARVSGKTKSMVSYSVPRGIEQYSYILEELQAALKTPVGYLTETVSSSDALYGDSGMVDIIHNLQLQLTGADISFAAPPVMGYRLPKGPITIGDVLYVQDLFNVTDEVPWMFTGEMTGAEIDAYLEYSYGMWFNQMRTVRDTLLTSADKYYMFDSAQGIKYTVNIRKPAGEKVTIKSTTADDMPFDMDKTYTVVMNAYRAYDVGKFLSRGAGLSAKEAQSRVLASYSFDLLKGFMMGDKMLGDITPEADGNWFASPQTWVEFAQKNN